MKYTHHILDKGSLYEFVYGGTTLYAIRRHHNDGRPTEDLGFNELPETIKAKIIKVLKGKK